MTTPTRTFITYAILLLSGIMIGWALFGTGTHETAHSGTDQVETRQDKVWTCSMHPSVREEGPGSCPICGMDLIPATSERRDDDYRMIMTEAAIELANIRTAPVIRETPYRKLQLPGRIAVDERKITYVTTHVEGRMKHVMIDFTGAPIRKGEVMASIYSTDLIAAQRELLEAAARRETNPRLYQAARQKFMDWDFTPQQIDQIEERGEVERTLDILSPTDGYVMKRNVVDGQHVMEGSVIYEVAVLDPLWVLLEAYEEDIDWIRTGDSIRFTTRSNPGRSLQAQVDYIDPAFHPASRTIRIRANIENRDRSLRPDMLVYGYLKSNHPEETLTIPESALLWTGPRSLVYVKSRDDDDHPLFEAREVTVGVRAGERRIIEEGLSEGEQVVVNGAFRVDSEFQLSGRFSMMNREPGQAAALPHDHGALDREQRDTASHTAAEGESSRRPVGVPDSFRAEITDLVSRYLLLKDALFASDSKQASNEAENVKKQLVTIGEHRLEGDAHMAWMRSYTALMEPLLIMNETTTIEELRESFRQLSELLIEAVKRFGIEGVVFHQYCPMEEADWLSDQSEIRNPYDPVRMPSCGDVIERIEFQVP